MWSRSDPGSSAILNKFFYTSNKGAANFCLGMMMAQKCGLDPTLGETDLSPKVDLARSEGVASALGVGRTAPPAGWVRTVAKIHENRICILCVSGGRPHFGCPPPQAEDPVSRSSLSQRRRVESTSSVRGTDAARGGGEQGAVSAPL